MLTFQQIYSSSSHQPDQAQRHPSLLKWHSHCANYAIYINPNRIWVVIFEFKVSGDFSKIIKIDHKTRSDNIYFFTFVYLPIKKINRMPATSPPCTYLSSHFLNSSYTPCAPVNSIEDTCRLQIFGRISPSPPNSWFNCRWDSCRTSLHKIHSTIHPKTLPKRFNVFTPLCLSKS